MCIVATEMNLPTATTKDTEAATEILRFSARQVRILARNSNRETGASYRNATVTVTHTAQYRASFWQRL